MICLPESTVKLRACTIPETVSLLLRFILEVLDFLQLLEEMDAVVCTGYL